MQQLGPANARTVLVLVPGTQGGAGGITPVARDIIARVPRTQVWIVDRREQAFEDTSAFRSGDPQAAQDYYLGFHYRGVPGDTRSSRRTGAFGFSSTTCGASCAARAGAGGV